MVGSVSADLDSISTVGQGFRINLGEWVARFLFWVGGARVYGFRFDVYGWGIKWGMGFLSFGFTVGSSAGKGNMFSREIVDKICLSVALFLGLFSWR